MCSAALIMEGSVLESAGSIRLWVFDAAVQECGAGGRSVDDPRAPAIFATDHVYPSGPGHFETSFEVSEGRRTFYIEVYAEDHARITATGCAAQQLTGGEHHDIRIWIYPVETPDAEEQVDAVEDEPAEDVMADETAPDVPADDMPADLAAEDAPVDPAPEDAPEDLAAEDAAADPGAEDAAGDDSTVEDHREDEVEIVADIADAGEDPGCEGPACDPSIWHDYVFSTPLDIPLYASIESTIRVEDCCFTVRDIRVGVIVRHSWIGDLTVTLERPGGPAIPLHKERGGSDDDIVGYYPAPLTPTVDPCVLTGEPSNGGWKLTVGNEGPREGTLDGWSLHLKGEYEHCREAAYYPFDSFPVAIPDNNPSGATSAVTVPSSFAVTGVGAYVSISHPYISDLVVTLYAPSGTDCILHYGSGGSSDDIITYYPDTTPPEESLSVFTGENALGTWTLKAVDEFPGDFGEINGWILYVY